jgi:NAD(P)-dependent dehydrogenase (short-subunit alcohol dehydrogenase family)
MMHEFSGDIDFANINAKRNAWCAAQRSALAALSSLARSQPALTLHARALCPSHRTIYANVKLANMLYTLELKKRLAAHAPGVLAVACHPGYTATGLQMTPGKGPAWVMGWMNHYFAQDVRLGAQPQLYAALGEDIESGDYTGPASKAKGPACKARGMRCGVCGCALLRAC